MREWLVSIGARRGLPASVQPSVREFLATEACGSDAPFSTLIALEVFRSIPDLRSPGLLRHLIEDPPLGVELVRWEAFQLIGASADADDMAFLTAQISSADVRRSRLALEAVGKSPRGRELILEFLEHGGDQLQQSSGRALTQALVDSRLSRDDDLLLRLLWSGNSVATEAAIRAVARTPQERAGNLVDALTSLVTQNEDGNAIEALSTAGTRGQSALLGIAESADQTPHVRLLALEAVTVESRRDAGSLILEMLPSLESTSDVQLAGSLGIQTGLPREDLAAGVCAWIAAHPGTRGEVIASLRTSRFTELRRFSETVEENMANN